jgi:hypothetical protein
MLRAVPPVAPHPRLARSDLRDSPCRAHFAMTRSCAGAMVADEAGRAWPSGHVGFQVSGELAATMPMPRTQLPRICGQIVIGGHNVLFASLRGTGKTMLARRIPSVLPEMTRDEALESTKVPIWY